MSAEDSVMALMTWRLVCSVLSRIGSGNESLDLQTILWDEQLMVFAAAVVDDRLLSWVPLHSPITIGAG